MSSGDSIPEASNDQLRDIEKEASQPQEKHRHQQHGGGIVSLLAVGDGEVYEPHPEKNPKWYQRLLDAGVEENGIKPVPTEERTITRYNNLFTVFLTSLLCLLP